MGGTNAFAVFKGDKAEVTRSFEQEQQVDRHENGHAYSGGFGQFAGIEFHDKEFASVDEAEHYVYEQGNKWGPAIAVRFKDGKQTEASLKKRKALEKKLQEVQSKINQLYSNAFKQFQNAKSKTAGCKACGSKINRKVIKGGFYQQEPFCICGNSLYSVSTKTSLEKAKAKEGEAKKALKDYKPTFSSTEISWAVGGFVSC